MIDLHTHSLFSDGALIPAELARRAEEIGYRFIGITDHVDSSNLDMVIPRVVAAANEMNRFTRVRIVPGVELTHVPPALFMKLTARARELGAVVVVAHGETVAEPVAPGTNLAAIEAGVDILAHPGLISEQDAALAARKGVLLEITARKGHSLTNGHVARMAKAVGARLVLNTDTHTPDNLITLSFARIIALGAGLSEEDFQGMREESTRLLKKKGVITD